METSVRSGFICNQSLLPAPCFSLKSGTEEQLRIRNPAPNPAFQTINIGIPALYVHSLISLRGLERAQWEPCCTPPLHTRPISSGHQATSRNHKTAVKNVRSLPLNDIGPYKPWQLALALAAGLHGEGKAGEALAGAWMVWAWANTLQANRIT